MAKVSGKVDSIRSLLHAAKKTGKELGFSEPGAVIWIRQIGRQVTIVRAVGDGTAETLTLPANGTVVAANVRKFSSEADAIAVAAAEAVAMSECESD